MSCELYYICNEPGKNKCILRLRDSKKENCNIYKEFKEFIEKIAKKVDIQEYDYEREM